MDTSTTGWLRIPVMTRSAAWDHAAKQAKSSSNSTLSRLGRFGFFVAKPVYPCRAFAFISSSSHGRAKPAPKSQAAKNLLSRCLCTALMAGKLWQICSHFNVVTFPRKTSPRQTESASCKHGAEHALIAIYSTTYLRHRRAKAQGRQDSSATLFSCLLGRCRNSVATKLSLVAPPDVHPTLVDASAKLQDELAPAWSSRSGESDSTVERTSDIHVLSTALHLSSSAITSWASLVCHAHAANAVCNVTVRVSAALEAHGVVLIADWSSTSSLMSCSVAWR
mmetsp:Transcript_20668/g.47414  ORF Transcript_20668/g.47414 Transcript_20668/m.47414 type:complete len:279 (-) Transcript_20668:2416-3252(-)